MARGDERGAFRQVPLPLDHPADSAGRARAPQNRAGPNSCEPQGATSRKQADGNAEETAAWVRANAIRSLIVVTAGYHMPRAMTELGRALPEVRLYPVSVVPPAMQGPGGVRNAGTLRLMAEEYTKWLAARLGLSGQPAG